MDFNHIYVFNHTLSLTEHGLLKQINKQINYTGQNIPDKIYCTKYTIEITRARSDYIKCNGILQQRSKTIWICLSR